MLATGGDSHQTLRARVVAKRSLDMTEPKCLSPKGIRRYLLSPSGTKLPWHHFRLFRKFTRLWYVMKFDIEG
jgi:hypothetical protein